LQLSSHTASNVSWINLEQTRLLSIQTRSFSF